ncbi:DUF3322 domain-containing protein [Mucilaginibacter paludis]|uniref:DUF3322 domain-containing protein n=1 Tax=Mucilaginibacter paludis TaxID=423351 RepID=UPI0012FB1145|nr:DUF3322 domain-containing protein [Mucilaginibacter paludis]
MGNLCKLYQWQAPDTTGLPFPQNISAVLEKLSGQRFDGAVPMLLQDKGSPARLATVKTYNTNYCLYYIPVRPLWQMKNVPSKQQHFELACSVFAYLYQVIGIPYYGDQSYMSRTYDSLENWISEIAEEGNEDDGDVTYRKRQFDELETLREAGAVLLPELKKCLDIAQWEKQVREFTSTDTQCGELRAVADELLKLAKDYPARAIRHSMHYELNEEEVDYQIYWENYISFYWSGKDTLETMLYEMVNNEFQEAGYQEEPIAVQWFDTPQDKPCHNFEFETRLFSLLDELTGILNDLDYENGEAL